MTFSQALEAYLNARYIVLNRIGDSLHIRSAVEDMKDAAEQMDALTGSETDNGW